MGVGGAIVVLSYPMNENDDQELCLYHSIMMKQSLTVQVAEYQSYGMTRMEILLHDSTKYL